MPNTKISNLSNAAALSGSEVTPIVQSGTTVKASVQNIANLALPSQLGNANRYLQTNGSVASWDAINLGTSDISGVLPIANGGTGQSNQTAAINALLPSQGGNNGRYLTTNGSDVSWATVSAGAVFTFASWRFSLSGGGASFTNLANTTGSVINVFGGVGSFLINSTGTPFTTNKTFVTCTNFRTNTPDLAIMGGIQFVDTANINVYFYDTTGGTYSFTGKTTTYTGTLTIQIYP